MSRRNGTKKVRHQMTIDTPQGVRPITKIEAHRYAEMCELVSKLPPLAEYRILPEHILPTYAELTKESGQRDEHMIFEMFEFSQYSDGSVLDCRNMRTYTAQQVTDGEVVILSKPIRGVHIAIQTAKDIASDLVRNAKAAIKNGTTRNLAPRV